MFKNYLKITFAILRRRKLFTFISLFGISFTLTVLIVGVAFMDHLFAPKYPELQRNHILYVSRTEIRDSGGTGANNSSVGRYFLHEYILKMKTPEKIAFATAPNTINAYSPNGTKLRLFYKHTDANFWELNNFDFVEGKPYTQSNIDNSEKVMVINENTRDDYFGKGLPVVGKSFELDNILYRVIGVVRGSPITRFFSSSDVYIPYNLKPGDALDKDIGGSYIVMLRGKTSEDLEKIKAEFESIIPKVPIPKGDKYFKPYKLYSEADSYIKGFSRQFVGNRYSSGVNLFYFLIFSLAFLFMSLPAINLININMNRIMERASEIGIRKAFGASSQTLTFQFIIENIIVSLIGSVLAIFLAAGAIYYINHCGIIPYADLTINWKVLIWGIIFSIAFGLLSGVYPAWRMSKMQVVDALKGGD
ncbi:MAG: ABC transporter permease [Saprospiraceae bacterium]